jgi:hypothetical protein
MVSAGLRPSRLELNGLGKCSLWIKWLAFSMIHNEYAEIRIGPRNLRQISIQLSFDDSFLGHYEKL